MATNGQITIDATGEGKLVITVEHGDGRPSASGKSVVLATTGGAQAVQLADGRQALVNLTLYVKR